MYELAELLPAIDPFNSSYVTRLHIRYTEEKFPEDLEFRIVGKDFEGFKEAKAISEKVSRRFFGIFQGRYVIRRTKGAAFCLAGSSYRELNKNWVENLKRLTGWDTKEIDKMASLKD